MKTDTTFCVLTTSKECISSLYSTSKYLSSVSSSLHTIILDVYQVYKIHKYAIIGISDCEYIVGICILSCNDSVI